MIRRLEKQQCSNADDASSKLSKLREDLIFSFEICTVLMAISTISSTKFYFDQLTETASDDDTLDVSDDDFFMSGSSSDEDADDEWTDKSAKEPTSSTSGKVTSSMSSKEKNQQRDARMLMPPPRSLAPNRTRPVEKHVSSNTSNSTRFLVQVQPWHVEVPVMRGLCSVAFWLQ
ncbi:hypothetical protein GUJ93_ZPchr0013g34583 [Zizania palustris]|uniref:Uncharacterized protein n=1 Tax=Zizania palustris TaxID=103762 RepID=A0A8J5WZF6_ZIZPA|nr:hypothetical protein GUJ93_ZPchr0013g34583 [Zizania palustris]